MSDRKCLHPGCDRQENLCRGVCPSHYKIAVTKGGVTLLPSKRAPSGEPLAFIQRHVEHRGGDCLIWPYSRYGNGYGAIYYEGVQTFAHRVMCRLAHGEPEYEDLEASHTCNKGHEGCLNPHHLVWETHLENHQRRRRAHRARARIKSKRLLGEPLNYTKGAKHHNAKLTEDQVLAIRADKRSMRLIALAYGMNAYTIRDIRERKTWRHV